MCHYCVWLLISHAVRCHGEVQGVFEDNNPNKSLCFLDAGTRAYTQTVPVFFFSFTQIRDDCVLRARGNTPQTTAAR